jgi:hypothetical protein
VNISTKFKLPTKNEPAPGPALFEKLRALYDFIMSDFIPKAAEIKVRGLGPKAQKLQALREKAAAQAKSGDKSLAGATTTPVKAKDSFAGTKKTSFQRKAV